METSKILFKKSIQFAKENFWQMTFLLFIIPVFLQVAFILFNELIFTTENAVFITSFSLVSFVIIYLVQFYVVIAMFKFIFAKIENSEYSFRECLILDKKKLFGLIALMVLFYSIVAVGLIALIIPGIILALRFSFSFVYLIIKDKKPIDSLLCSYSLIYGRTWVFLKKIIYPIIPLFLIWMIGGIVFILGFFLNSIFMLNPYFAMIMFMLIGLVFAYLYLLFAITSSVYGVYLFKEFEKTKTETSLEIDSKRLKNFKIMAVIGVIVLVISSIIMSLL